MFSDYKTAFEFRDYLICNQQPLSNTYSAKKIFQSKKIFQEMGISLGNLLRVFCPCMIQLALLKTVNHHDSPSDQYFNASWLGEERSIVFQIQHIISSIYSGNS